MKAGKTKDKEAGFSFLKVLSINEPRFLFITKGHVLYSN